MNSTPIEVSNDNQPDITSRVRVMFHMVIGVEKGLIDVNTFELAMAELDTALTRLTGGVTRLGGRGTWVDGGAANDFSARIERNFTAMYFLSVMPEREVVTLAGIRKELATIAALYDLPLSDIHIERVVSEAHHVKIGA